MQAVRLVAAPGALREQNAGACCGWMSLAKAQGHAPPTAFADYAGVRNTNTGARIFGADWAPPPPVPGVAGRPATDADRMEYRSHLEPFQAAPYGHTDAAGRVLNGMARTKMPTKEDTTASDMNRGDKWNVQPTRSCKRVGLQSAPFAEGRNMRDSYRGRVTTKQLEYRAPSLDALANPGRRLRYRNTGLEALAPARAASEEPVRSRSELADAKADLQRRQARMQWRESERQTEPFKARPMPDFSRGDDVAREVLPGGRRGLRRANAYLREEESAAHKSEIAVKRHRQKILQEEMQLLQDRRAVSPGLQQQALRKARVQADRARRGEPELEHDELDKFITKRGCAVEGPPRRRTHHDTENTNVDHRAHRHKFSYIGTTEFDKLDDDKRFIQLVAEQRQYMEQHDSLPPAPLAHRVGNRRQHNRGAHSKFRGASPDWSRTSSDAIPAPAAMPVDFDSGLTQGELERLEATERSVMVAKDKGTELSRMERMVQPPTLVTFSTDYSRMH